MKTTTDVVTVARTVLNSNYSEVMFHSNGEDIRSRFAILLLSVKSMLEANHVTSMVV